MQDFSQLDKNTVEAKGQLKGTELVRFFNPEGKGKRIMFVGNSITLHGYRPKLGWYGEWGMAASAAEKDYVHLLMSRVQETDPDAAFCICQVASWEKEYKDGRDQFPLFENAHNFDADIIVLRYIENCPKQDFDSEAFRAESRELFAWLDPKKKAKYVVATSFWHHPGDPDLEILAKELNAPLVFLGDLGDLDEMKATGLFASKGVSHHPGDLGMANIAQRIFPAMQQYL